MNWYLTQVISQDGNLIPAIYQTEDKKVVFQHIPATHPQWVTKVIYNIQGTVHLAYEDDPIVEGTNVLIATDDPNIPTDLATPITDWDSFLSEHPNLADKIPGEPDVIR
jgi:hypothetical protein